jgi:hypothetical protein
MLKFKGGGGDSKAQRSSLPKEMAASLAEQFSSLHGQDLGGFTYEQRRSAQTGARFDISIYDAAGALRYEGRKFDGAQSISFWKPEAE